VGSWIDVRLEDSRLVLDSKLAAELARWGSKLKAYLEGRSLIIVPAVEALDARHPWIVSVPGICGGEPVIAGTRITVRDVVEYFRLYGNKAQILRALPHLEIAQVDDALGYYEHHRDEIDRYIAENQAALQEKP